MARQASATNGEGIFVLTIQGWTDTRSAIARFTIVSWLAGAGSLFVLGPPTKAQAQTIFCPASFADGVDTPLTNGACTNGVNGAFSGAALSELSDGNPGDFTRSSNISIRDFEGEGVTPLFLGDENRTSVVISVTVVIAILFAPAPLTLGT